MSQPNHMTLRTLFQKLDFDSNNVAAYFLDAEENEFRRLVMQFDSNVGKNTPETAASSRAILEQLEQSEKFMSDRLKRQYIMRMRANLLYTEIEGEINAAFGMVELSPTEKGEVRKITPLSSESLRKQDEMEKLINEALKITIPEFNLHYLHEYYLSLAETDMVHMLAKLYRRKNDLDGAIKICRQMQESVESIQTSGAEKAAKYTTIMYTLDLMLNEKGEHTEAIKACDAALEVAHMGFRHILHPFIYFYKAEATFALGDKEAALDVA